MSEETQVQDPQGQVLHLPTGKLARALAAAQAEFKTVSKSKTAKGEKFSYKYADLNDVLGMVLPILSKHGIAFTQPIRREGDKTYVVTRIQLDEEFAEDAGFPVPLQTRPQELGTYLTYYRRYLVSSFLGISSDEDSDAIETREDFKPSAKPSPEKKSKPAAAPAKAETKPEPSPIPDKPAAQPQENPQGIVPTDDDVPDNIGRRPSKEEREEFFKRIADKKIDFRSAPFKEFVLKTTGKSSGLTVHEWETLINALPGDGKL